MIDVLVRAKNETHWLPQLLGSIERQVGVEIGRVLIVDNASEDRPRDLVRLYPGLDIEVLDFGLEYFPGKMLNYGLAHLMKNSRRALKDRVLIISAHCFMTNETSLASLAGALDRSGLSSRAAFGRQIPMLQSDSMAVRDLALMYPNESRTASRAAAFNNAFSLISYSALQEHLFDEEVTNLEDVLWADEEISRGFSLAYVAESVVAHHHGPHHGDRQSRLDSTRITIERHRKVFHFEPAQAVVNPSEILPILITEGKNQALTELLPNLLGSGRVLVWSSRQEQFESLKASIPRSLRGQIVLLERPSDVPSSQDSTLFDVLPVLGEQLVSSNLDSNYYLLFDDSYDEAFGWVSPSLAAKNLSLNYRPATWPVTLSKSLYFTETDGGVYLPSQLRDSTGHWRKAPTYKVLRGNGTMFTRAAMTRPHIAFSDFDFVEVQSLG